MNKLLAILLKGETEEALKHYQALGNPSPTEQRWAGLALFYHQEYFPARDLLLEALARGCVPARIELATVWRYLGNVQEAQRSLEGVKPECLSAFDRTLWLREAGCVHFAEGQIQEAVMCFERAWAIAFTAEAGEALRAGIGQMLALALHTQGHSVTADRYLQKARKGVRSPVRLAYLCCTGGLIATYLADFEKARQAYSEATELSAATPAIQTVLTYNRGLLERYCGNYRVALALFGEAGFLAQDLAEEETECYAAQSESAVLTHLGELGQARAALQRVRALTRSPQTKALVQMREGTLALRAGQSKDTVLLEQAAATFQELHLRREFGWASLHIADAHLRLGDNSLAKLHAERAADVRFELTTGAPLLAELRELPLLLEHLASLPLDAYARCLYTDYLTHLDASPRRVFLRTLGVTELLVDGRPVTLGFRQAVPVLAYLMLNQPVPIRRVVTDLFPDADAKIARNYFHQVRHQVEKVVLGVSVQYGDDRRYRLQGEGVTITWDYLEVLNAVHATDLNGLQQALDLYDGAFLEHLEDEWVVQARERLRTSLLRNGMKILRRTEQPVNYQALELCWKLLAVDPGSEDIGLVLVELYRALEGDTGARLARAKLRAHFQRTIDTIPPAFFDSSSPQDSAELN